MPWMDLPTESCMSRASRARSWAAPTAATASAACCRASTIDCTLRCTTEPITQTPSTSAGIPATRASQPCQLVGAADRTAAGAPRLPITSGTISSDQHPAGEQQTGDQRGTDHGERRPAGPR